MRTINTTLSNKEQEMLEWLLLVGGLKLNELQTERPTDLELNEKRVTFNELSGKLL
jgi:hypothetical protein